MAEKMMGSTMEPLDGITEKTRRAYNLAVGRYHDLYHDEVVGMDISDYSILDTPKHAVGGLFREFRRVLKPGGLLLAAVKAGTTEGVLDEILGLKTPVYFSLFSPDEIRDHFKTAGFAVEFLETRKPNEKEIPVDRIYARGRKA